MSPSIASLGRLAVVLGVTLEGFSTASTFSPVVVVRGTDRQQLVSAWSQATIEALGAAGGTWALEPIMITLAPGGRSGPRPHTARGEQLGNGIAAYEAVPTALYAFLRYPDSFPRAVTYAISLGGDTDTIASMTGALAGAYLGAEAIPYRWREHVEGGARLLGLADALLSLATRSA